jgi:hypothetical protein
VGRDRVGFVLRGFACGKRVAVGGLIEKIVVTPAKGEDGGLALALHGALASLLRFATGASVYGARDGTTANGPARARLSVWFFYWKGLVAGTGFEPVTFRL